MDGSPLHISRLRLSVDGVTEHVEHPRNDLLANGHLQGGARVLDWHSSGQTLRGRQGIERVFKTDKLPLDPAKLLGGEKRLCEKSFQPPGASDRVAIFRRELFQAEHRDDILER